ncbi:hypothetical protein [Archangium primigenium]|uniref:hypothetical protein n=1 Tax=[Archangium] primigenium TaxID=2792470 RepID=UPI00195A2140|nr:hypothetical protein [Archangium primigenium]MBM7113543.1 hypothetical protein [Archangium primigenium]
MKHARRLLLASLLALSACEDSSPDPTPLPDAGAAADAGVPPGTPPGEPVPDAGTPTTNVPRFEHYIRRQPYPRMVLEVDGWGGYTPTASVADKLTKGLLGILDKESVEVRVDQAFPGKGKDHAWTNQELLALAEETGTLEVPVGTIKLHVLLVDGHSAMDTDQGRVLGLAFPWTHLVLFRQTMDTLCNKGSPLNPCAKAELGVWAHEVGHQLGLVSNGLAMSTPHKDETHGAHDASDTCIMYWAYEGSSGLADLIGLFGDAPNLGFDAACLADLDAVKNRP